MTLRIATLDDIEAMHAIRMSVVENQLRDPTHVTHVHYRELLGRADARGWVFEIEGELVGFGVADSSTRNIWALFIKPQHERRGIGRALHDAMITWLFEVGDTPCWLTTEPGTRAERFYVAAGWTIDQSINETITGELRLVLSSL